MKKPKMVDWYDPRQLLQTAQKTLISTIIGENADPRLVTAPVSYGKYFDYSVYLRRDGEDGKFAELDKVRDEIVIDYVSDVGDGWPSTYSVAHALARPSLTAGAETVDRGEILIFGGDQVYPTADLDNYAARLVDPYETAFRTIGGNPDGDELKASPHVFAIPGNHDWYDSLVAFYKVFCTHLFNDRRFARGWTTRQKRSYFALKLPQKWWLIGADLQLSHNIDVRQLSYFESVAAQFEPGDRLILCVPEPYWVKALKYSGYTKFFEKKEETLELLEQILTKSNDDDPPRIMAYLAGDLHHYRRFQSEDGSGVQKITAGGGGAFLHPTHDFDFERHFARREKSDRDFSIKCQYPNPEESRNLDWANLYAFPIKNPTFGIITMMVYPLLALLIHGQTHGRFDWTTLFRNTIDRLIEEPLSLAVICGLILALIFFTDSNSKIQKWFGGLLHALTHLGAAFVVGWLAFFVSIWLLGTSASDFDAYRQLNPTSSNVVWFVSVIGIGGVIGYIVGPLIMGIYLFVSLHIFGRHDNEAFSALKIEDYKNFLRLRIDSDGTLTIFPFKIDRIPRNWRFEGNRCEPETPFEPELIEDPIVIRRSAGE